MENKTTKRYYKKNEVVWIVPLKREGIFQNINKETFEVTVTTTDGGNTIKHVLKAWEIDKIKYKAKEELVKSKRTNKVTYFASVNGGIIPTKTEENAGRDCYARLEPVIREGKQVFELLLPHLKLTKIPLGFASYLNLDDVLSLKHERSSIGGVGLINLSGLIDATYQGEVILQAVPLVSDVVITSEVDEKYFDESLNTWFVPYSKAITQAVVLKISEARDEHIDYKDLLNKPSTRGTSGWGSSGK